MEQKYKILQACRAAAFVWAYGGRLGFSHSSLTIFLSRSTRLAEQLQTISIFVNRSRFLPAETATPALLPRTSTIRKETTSTTWRERLWGHASPWIRQFPARFPAIRE